LLQTSERSFESKQSFVKLTVSHIYLPFSIGPRHFSEPDLPSPTTPTHRLQPLANAPDTPDGPVLNKPDVTDHVVVQVS
jgi:hypothetical protein